MPYHVAATIAVAANHRLQFQSSLVEWCCIAPLCESTDTTSYQYHIAKAPQHEAHLAAASEYLRHTSDSVSTAITTLCVTWTTVELRKRTLKDVLGWYVMQCHQWRFITITLQILVCMHQLCIKCLRPDPSWLLKENANALKQPQQTSPTCFYNMQICFKWFIYYYC